MIHLSLQDNTIPNLKAHISAKYDPRGLSYGSTLNIYQDVMKSGDLLHKRNFVDSQSNRLIDTIAVANKYTPSR